MVPVDSGSGAAVPFDLLDPGVERPYRLVKREPQTNLLGAGGIVRLPVWMRGQGGRPGSGCGLAGDFGLPGSGDEQVPARFRQYRQVGPFIVERRLEHEQVDHVTDPVVGPFGGVRIGEGVKLLRDLVVDRDPGGTRRSGQPEMR